MGNTGSNKVCSAFGRCGGCAFLDVPYEVQLMAKRKVVEDVFAEIPPNDGVDDVLGMDRPYGYRDKVVAPFVAAKEATRNPKGPRATRGKHASKRPRNGSAVISGMYERGTHNVIECEGCALENPVGQRVVHAVKSIMGKHGIEPYDEDSGTGFMRHALIRVGHETDEMLVVLVTNSDEFPGAKPFCRELVKRVPGITSIVQNVNRRQTNVILGDREKVLYGPGFILDRLMGLTFRISSSSFYQVNREMTSSLYGKAMELADIGPEGVILDAYCGTGTIGLAALASGGSALVGVDDSESSIRDARLNAKHNGVAEATFHCEDASEFMRDYDGPKPDVAFIDPPRSGSTPEFLQSLGELGPKRIVYISCNPITQARDAVDLARQGYELQKVCPVDMFPHTQHVETVALFQRK